MIKQYMFSISSSVIVMAILAGMSIHVQAQSVDITDSSKKITNPGYNISDIILEPVDVSFGQSSRSIRKMFSQDIQSGPKGSMAVEWPAMNNQDEDRRKGFFWRNKYWIIGGAAAVLVTSTALIINSRGGDSDPFIPDPPGRP